ncbi:MAG TPA: hypothetical protein VNA17_05435 [Pyrinomonadaceae bacterium]|nr:hypothetical protein [Pyrinomonadaceae bacterium]
MKNVELVIRYTRRSRRIRQSRVWAALITAITTAFLSGCQKLEYDHCTSKEKPSEFWSRYDLPKVEGAELCSENDLDESRGLTFVHYHDAEQSYTDYSDPYEDGFAETGWKTAKVTSSKSAWGMYVAREADTLYVSFADCYAGQEPPFRRSCTAVSIRQTNGIPPIK